MNTVRHSPESSIKIVLIDDEKMIRSLIVRYLRKHKYNIEAFESAERALAVLAEDPADIVVTDLHLPKMNGLEFLERIKKLDASAEVIIITGHADKAAAVDALRLGAFDLLEKPIDLKMILAAIQRTVRYQEALRTCEKLNRQIEVMTDLEGERWGIDKFVGKSNVVKSLLRQVTNLQKHDKISVLIQGESGTGKELIAHAIHYGSSRSKGPMVPVNCSAVPVNLAESVFFGHTKGSFTGATTDRKGCFESADGGTLFLDEIGDMPAAIQIKLLRVLEDETVVPVGAPHGVKVDVRVIAATNADLEKKVREGSFRQDLYFRLARYAVRMPPLREHSEDIPMLVQHFVAKISAEMRVPEPTVSNELIGHLQKMPFKGNVRELRNIIERAIITCSGSELGVDHLQDGSNAQSAEGSAEPDVQDIPEDLRKAQSWLIKRAVDRCNGNISEAARRLGVTRAKVYRHK